VRKECRICVFVANKWIDKVSEFRHISSRLVIFRVIVGEYGLNFNRCNLCKLKQEQVKRVFFNRKSDIKNCREIESKGVDMVWKGLNACLLDVADKVCGRTMGQPRHSQTCW